jgi:hypothetical protein
LNVSSQNYRSILEKEINISKKKSKCKLVELQNLGKTKKKSKMQVHKITCLWSLKQKLSKKRFECKLVELQMFGGKKNLQREVWMEVCKIIDLGEDKEFPKWSLNASLQSTNLGEVN